MKRVFLLATAAMMMAGVAMAHEGGKGKKKKCAKGKSCCKKEAKAEKKSCCSKDSKTAKI